MVDAIGMVAVRVLQGRLGRLEHEEHKGAHGAHGAERERAEVECMQRSVSERLPKVTRGTVRCGTHG